MLTKGINDVTRTTEGALDSQFIDIVIKLEMHLRPLIALRSSHDDDYANSYYHNATTLLSKQRAGPSHHTSSSIVDGEVVDSPRVLPSISRGNLNASQSVSKTKV